MKRSRFPGCVTVLLLALASAASAQPPSVANSGGTPVQGVQREKRPPESMTVADITTCMRANVVDRGSLREIEMVSVDREGNSRKLRMKLFWKPAKDTGALRSVVRVTEPAAYAGGAYLAINKPEGDEVYLYLPALDRVQRIVGDQDRSLFGTDFTHSDVEQFQAILAAGETKRLADATVADRTTFVLEVATNVDATGYTAIKSYVDQATCTLLKSEFFVSGPGPQKVLEADLSTLISAEPYWLILGYTMRDLGAGTRTNLSLSDVYLREQLPETMFDPATFYSVTP
jgi:hypothetical protein